MAISTIKATMQMRRGMETDFDADQMTAGEWAVSTDTKYVRMCFAPGVVRRMATYESFEADLKVIQEILATCQNIQAAVEAFERLAEQHKNDAAASAAAALSSQNAAAASAAAALSSENAAAASAQAAKDSEVAAKESETNAKDSETAAKTSENNAKDSEVAAKTSEVNAKDSETAAKDSETAAANSAAAALESETGAGDYAALSESWAVGGTDTREGEDENNSKYWAGKAEQGAAAGGWMSFMINEVGHLMMYRRGVEDINFTLNNGRLEVALG